MALIKTSNEIADIRGQLGGIYFTHDKSGLHISAMPRVVGYTRSPLQKGLFRDGITFQMFGIDGYSGAAVFWLMALIAYYAATWAVYAAMYLFRQEDGDEIKITGYNWYIHYALAYPECERPPFWKPPHSPTDLPDYICTYRGTWFYEHEPNEWPTISPGDYYWRYTTYNGKDAYLGDDRKWWLWWKDPVWVLSQALGIEIPGESFYSDGADIRDWYRDPVTKKYAHVYLGKPED